jgi:hypothetical protein
LRARGQALIATTFQVQMQAIPRGKQSLGYILKCHIEAAGVNTTA